VLVWRISAQKPAETMTYTDLLGIGGFTDLLDKYDGT
jgi:hypothetical protein